MRDGGAVQGIVEHKDATPAQRAITEVYTGMMAAPTAVLKRWVAALKNDNAQREYCLIDIVPTALADGVPEVTSPAPGETEVNNSTLADGTKANHLAYLGDATVGPRVNYGAGRITANHNGANKHRAVISADLHLGSNCLLVAPLSIGDGATIAGGSTIKQDVPAGQLALGRGCQAVVAGWVRPVKAAKTDTPR